MKNPGGGVREWLSLEFDEAQQLSDAGEVSRGYTVTPLHISVHAKAEFCKRTDWADLETRLLAFSELREVVVRVIPAEHTFDAPVADFLDAARAILDIMEKMASLHHGGKLRVGFAPAAWMSNRSVLPLGDLSSGTPIEVNHIHVQRIIDAEIHHTKVYMLTVQYM